MPCVRKPQGLDALGYSEHVDYDLVESTNPAFNKAIVRVNVFRDHRQVPVLAPPCCCAAACLADYVSHAPGEACYYWRALLLSPEQTMLLSPRIWTCAPSCRDVAIPASSSSLD